MNAIAAAAWVQAIAALAVVVATAWLARITNRYVRITDDALKVSREHLKRYSGVYAQFGLRPDENGTALWVANIGAANFLLSEVHIRRPNTSLPKVVSLNKVIPSGRLGRRFPLSPQFYDDNHPNYIQDLDISLFCVSSGEKRQTEWRAFAIFGQGKNRSVREGLHGLWPVNCPKCCAWGAMSMRTDGLDNLDSAWDRRSNLEQDLRSTCPDHKSQWLVQPS